MHPSRRKTIHHVIIIIIHNFSTEILTPHVHYQENPIKQMLCNYWDWTGLMAIFSFLSSSDYSCISKFSFFFSQIRMDHVKENSALVSTDKEKKLGSTQCGENGALKTRDICWMAENNKNGSKITLKKKRRWNCTKFL